MTLRTREELEREREEELEERRRQKAEMQKIGDEVKALRLLYPPGIEFDFLGHPVCLERIGSNWPAPGFKATVICFSSGGGFQRFEVLLDAIRESLEKRNGKG